MTKHERILNFDDARERAKVANGINKLRGRWRLTLKPCRPNKSNAQLGWLFGCIYPAIRDGLVEAWGEKLTVDEVHEWARARFLAKPLVNHDTGELEGVVPGSVSKLDTAAMADYCEQLRKFAAEYLGVNIPDPDPAWLRTEKQDAA